jgi:hypothetical protein
MSQAGFIERWCLNNVIAEVSSDADGSAVVRVHVPPLNAVTFQWPLRVLEFCLALSLLFGPYCLLAVCPLCWLPRRLVYVRHVRILDSKKKHHKFWAA